MRSAAAVATVILLSLNTVATAKETAVILEMSSGDSAEAAYWAGEPDMPAILIQHGFLQTRHFPTVRRLALALADSGFTVLTPTLTLGIDRRTASLPCEAVHTHTMEHTQEEIAIWVDWLYAKTGQEPVVIGHSAGSINLLDYLTHSPGSPVAHAIFISVTYFGHGEAAFESPEHATRARAALARGEAGLAEYALGFCRQYVTTPAAYLSYYDWDKQRTNRAFQSCGVSSTLIAGSADDRIDLEWIETLQQHGAEVRIVEGANHFFDQFHEFDLLDEIEHVLQGHRAQ
ncbi:MULTISPECIES: alpha/beta hydrolase [unclassified Thioalkalivibrio]|uniref:alpha/beta hydrolase n=1 Tax=unclassified Thioalkalivibrio TaxID=2621013 RepID=UPI000477FAF2|nr:MULTISPECIES: alpha/beta fold hydrolase [unclassified Thioalkalivibrio]